eukprot:g24203.t1
MRGDEATSGAVDAVDHTDRCAGEPLSNVEGLLCALNRGEEEGAEPDPYTDTFFSLTELVLTINNFSFNSSHFLQTKGVAMGTRMGPSYACLFVECVEQSLFRCYTGPIPHLFLCYVVDSIGAASCFHKELEQIVNFTFHTNLKFTWTISDTSLFFRDLSVSIS